MLAFLYSVLNIKQKIAESIKTITIWVPSCICSVSTISLVHLTVYELNNSLFLLTPNKPGSIKPCLTALDGGNWLSLSHPSTLRGLFAGLYTVDDDTYIDIGIDSSNR